MSLIPPCTIKTSASAAAVSKRAAISSVRSPQIPKLRKSSSGWSRPAQCSHCPSGSPARRRESQYGEPSVIESPRQATTVGTTCTSITSADNRPVPPLSVCLTFDFDALSPWVFEMAEGNVAALSRGEFGAVAVPRILDLLERHGLPATFFVPGHTALAYPALVRRIAAAGHEIGHHGWVHEGLSRLDAATERDFLLRGLDALDRVAGVRPLGYRAPGVDVSVNTVDILL